MYDFFFYTGATGNKKCNGRYVVKRLVQGLPKMKIIGYYLIIGSIPYT